MSSSPWDGVAKQFGMHTAATFSRGSAGLFALFLALAKRYGAGEIIVPALCCESVAMAAGYAGHTVRFADVSEESLCITAETLAPLMSADTRAVLIVHLYGIDAEVAGFSRLRQLYPQALFVEDIAHAIGGNTRDGEPLGGGLDVALLSFADGKIVAGDGGALLFSAAHTELQSQTLAEAPQGKREELPRLALSLRNFVHGIADCWRENPTRKVPPIFEPMADAYTNLIAMAGDVADPALALEQLGKLAIIRDARMANYREYRKHIDPKVAKVVFLHKGSICWRCPVLLPNAKTATKVTANLREAGIPASNHYFPLNVLYARAPCSSAENLATRIVNLWVDDSVLPAQIEHTAAIINRT